MKSWKTPTPSDVDRAVGSLSQPAHVRYFFDRLKNPEWIGPLEARGYFRNPPPPQEDKEHGAISFPLWPQSRYLARAAAERPDTVSDLILRIPDTKNVRVHEDFVEAAIAMPPDVAARLVGKASRWIRSPYQFVLAEKLGQLIAKLAEGNQTLAALALAKAVLDVVPDPRRRRTKKDDEFALPPEASARFDAWHYERILRRQLRPLTERAPSETFDLLADLLEKAVKLSRPDRGKHRDPEDYSYIWRPAVEDRPQNRRGDIKNLLVTAVRDLADAIATRGEANVRGVIQRLEARPWRVFHRVALHFLRRFRVAVPDLVADHATNRDLFDETWARHEYSGLLRESFRDLRVEQQEQILGWIAAGPDVEAFKRAQIAWTGQAASADDIEKFRMIWQRDHLSIIEGDLPPEWRRRYEELVQQFGESEYPDFGSYEVQSWGPTSPRSIDDLKRMSIGELVEFLREWNPAEGDFAPSPEGLGRLLTDLVGAAPVGFADDAELFIGLDPTYVRSVLRGFEEAARRKQDFPWSQIVSLCDWISEQEGEIPGRERRLLHGDPHWGWARKEVARLLSVGFQQNTLPLHLRQQVWTVLERITDDVDPVAGEEGEASEPATRAINSVRGEAMHAVIHYALWVRRSLENLADGEERRGRGFAEMPEVDRVLTARLDDHSLAIRSVYGQYFPWLVLLDPNWARDHRHEIFPPDERHRPLCDAAWDTYVVFCQPYDNVFEVLHTEYRDAVRRLSVPSGDQKRTTHDPGESLAEHLMALYWRGRVDANEDILTSFWSTAPPAVRRHALAFIGRSLADTQGPVPDDRLGRIQALWLRRLEAAKANPGAGIDELPAFGWWFTSGKFDEAWAIAQLREAVTIAKTVDDDSDVAKQLAASARRWPTEVVECFRSLIEGDGDGWRVYAWRDAIQDALTAILNTSRGETRVAAEKLAHRLGEKGHFEFGELLRGGGSALS